MNIFRYSDDPIECAQWAPNMHVGKLAIEMAQLLSNAHHMLDRDTLYYKKRKNKLCRINNPHHPLSRWVCESQANYVWVYQYFDALCMEYALRYDKTHGIYLRNYILKFTPSNIPALSTMTPMPLCIPHDLHKRGMHEGYREYLRREKKHLHRWKRRMPPTWIWKE